MQRQGLMAMSVNLVLLAFLFSGVPLPTKLSDRIGMTPFLTESIGGPMRIAGGNLVQEYAAICLLAPDEDSSMLSSKRDDTDADNGGSEDVVCTRYYVYGGTLKELESAVTDAEDGVGPYDGKEDKRYAAYVKAEYEIVFHPVIQGFWREDGKVAVELGCGSEVRPKIRMYLPSFQPDDPALKAACEAEEKRLEQHEMGHVAIFRLCGKGLQDTLDNMQVIGRGPNIWVAMISAYFELGKTVNSKLDEAVVTANCMNKAVDVLTNHGRGLF